MNLEEFMKKNPLLVPFKRYLIAGDFDVEGVTKEKIINYCNDYIKYRKLTLSNITIFKNNGEDEYCDKLVEILKPEPYIKDDALGIMFSGIAEMKDKDIQGLYNNLMRNISSNFYVFTLYIEEIFVLSYSSLLGISYGFSNSYKRLALYKNSSKYSRMELYNIIIRLEK